LTSGTPRSTVGRMKKPERYTVKRAMALKPSEWRALRWYGRRVRLRGLASLRKVSLDHILKHWRASRKGPKHPDGLDQCAVCQSAIRCVEIERLQRLIFNNAAVDRIVTEGEILPQFTSPKKG